jgi:DNA-binding response OmpR family regulator
VIADIGRHGRGFEIFNTVEDGDEEIPIIVLTEQNADLFQTLAMVNGASEVLTTPLNPEELQEAVTRLSEHGFRA